LSWSSSEVFLVLVLILIESRFEDEGRGRPCRWEAQGNAQPQARRLLGKQRGHFVEALLQAFHICSTGALKTRVTTRSRFILSALI
jgi:hypothetical protein